MSAPTLTSSYAAGDDGDRAAETVLARELRAAVADRLAEASRLAERVTGAPMTHAERTDAVHRLVMEALDGHANASLSAGRSLLTPQVEARIGQAIRDRFLGLGGLERHINDPSVEDIRGNGCDQITIRRADGSRVQVEPVADSDEDLIDLLRMVAARSGNEERRFDRGNPMVSVVLADGSRLFAVMSVSSRPLFAIRRHRFRRTTLAELAGLGLMDQALVELFAAAVRARLNFMVAGPAGVGKTTFVRALASEIPSWERIVTVEDVAELRLDEDPAHPDAAALQAREANLEGEGAISLGQLIRGALRMSPDRVIVGEVRGGEELLAALNAMSMGTDGSMATIHASSSRGVFGKLIAYAAQSAEKLDAAATNAMVGDALDLVVHIGYTRDGQRVVTSVREVTGCDGGQVTSNELFRPGADRRAVPGSPPSGELLDRLIDAGLDPAWLHACGGGWTR
jgi:pilus assembly protein CpaF